jgi:glycosyltransferase involved in cell wall biosynthesis
LSSVSVVIPFYNSAATLERCVHSVLDGGVKPLEIVLVDDGSGDESSAIARALEAAHPGVVRALRLADNGGPARARNRGAALARGEFLLFVDSDTHASPDMIERFLRRIPEADAVTGIYDLEPLNDGAVPRYKAYFTYCAFADCGVIPYETFSSHTAGIKTAVFRELGGYDESLRWGMDYENEEFGRRIILRHKLLLDPEFKVRHFFPGFAKLTRTYFNRVSLWMEFFLRRPKLESGGTATARIGLGTAAAPAALGCAALSAFAPAFGWGAAAFALLYLHAMSGFFAFVARHRSGFLPAAIVLNLYFSVVISIGAAYGLLRAATGTGRLAAPKSGARS